MRVSDSLPLQTSTPEGWAEFLAGLTHGPEIRELRTYIVTFGEVQEICGSRALGCYELTRWSRRGGGRGHLSGGGRPTRVRPPRGVSPSELTVVGRRLGPEALGERGQRVREVSRREAFPGDEGAKYARNPGEAWAEAFRLMDERKAGITTATWPIVAQSFFPNEAALQAAEQDVLQPWAAASTRAFTKVFGKKTAKVWWIPLATPLDGDSGSTRRLRMAARPRSRSSTRPTHRPQACAVGRPAPQAARSSICGRRSLFVRVTHTGALGRVRVSVTAP